MSNDKHQHCPTGTIQIQSDPTPNPPLLINALPLHTFLDGFLGNRAVRLLPLEDIAFFNIDGRQYILRVDCEVNCNTPVRVAYPERAPEPEYRYPPIAPEPSTYVPMLPYVFIRIPLLEKTPDGVELEPAPIPILIARPALTTDLIGILDRYNPGIAVAHLDSNTTVPYDAFRVGPKTDYRAIVFDAVPDALADIQLGQPVFLHLNRPCHDTLQCS